MRSARTAVSRAAAAVWRFRTDAVLDLVGGDMQVAAAFFLGK
jgi:hypothetical protein